MKNAFQIPDKSLKYVLFQRTTYITALERLEKLGFKGYPSFLTYERAVALEAILRKNGIKKEYLDDLAVDFDTIKAALPENCVRMLDIGCGIAGIDLFISQHYQNNIDIYLLDKTHLEEKVFYMFKDRGAFYNSLALAKECLTSNNISSEKVHLREANEQNEIAIDTTLDLVISLISWGYHYPIETYLNRVFELLRLGGVLIVDVRKKTKGLDRIKEVFGDFDILVDAPKHSRIVAIKK